ncbi:uncharacterized protein LOC144821551 isoform X3 [Lissotriton helveticus]
MESQEAQRDAAERKRKQKFSQEELQVLISEVVRHYGNIFGKQTLHVAESIKRSTWLDIQGKVNAIGVTHRDLEDLKKRWYDIRIITKKKLAAHRKESAATGGGRNRAPRLTDIEEMVASTLEKECIHGIGDADSSARGAKKPGESKRSTAEVREKRREGAGPSTSHGGQDQEQAAPIPEEATAENPQSPLLFGSQDTGAAELSPTPTSPSPVLGRVRSHDVPPRRILQTSSEEDEVEGDTQDRGNTEQQPSPRVTRASVRGRRPREVEDVRQVQGVFCGREATMVKVQRLQAKAMMGVQRHARTTNNKLEAVGKGIGEMAESMQSMASGISDITQCMTVLCDKLDRDHLERRKARVDVRQQTKALNRFATATTVLCRRSVTMQDAIVQCCNNLSEGMARMTSAMELVLAHQTGTGGDTCAAESEGSTSRSGASTPVHELRRSGRRGGSVTGQREDIDSQPQQPRPVARGHKQ